MTTARDRLLGEIAVDRGYLTQDELDEAREAHRAVKAMGVDQPLIEILVGKHLITPDQAQDLVHVAAVETGEARLVAGYEVVSKLGQGGMGVVYRARRLLTGESVALKILPPSLADKDRITRFRRESEIVKTLHHENIVGFVEFGFDEKKKLWFCAEELVEGEDLDKRIARLGTLSEDEAVSITYQLAQALQHAYFSKLIHRDVKPANVVVTPDGTAKLLDLGLARPVSVEITRVTQSGMLLGTPHYVSPEQARSEKVIDTRSDIYSLGATLYHMVTGRPPFEGGSALMILQRHVYEKLTWPAELKPELTDEVCRIIAKMMAKEAADRYQKPNELLRDLDALIHGNEVHVGDDVLRNSSVALAVAPRPRRSRAAVRSRLPRARERAARRRAPATDKHALRKKTPSRSSSSSTPAPSSPFARAVLAWNEMSPSRKQAVAIGAGAFLALVLAVVVFSGGGKERSGRRDERRRGGATRARTDVGSPRQEPKPPPASVSGGAPRPKRRPAPVRRGGAPDAAATVNSRPTGVGAGERAALPRIVNGSMTEGDRVPSGWAQTWAKRGRIEVARDTVTFAKGPASLRVTSIGADAEVNVSQEITNGRGMLTVRGSFKCEGVKEGMVAVNGFDGEGVHCFWENCTHASGGSDWREFSHEVTLPAKVARAYVVLLLKGEGTAWLDEVEIVAPKDARRVAPLHVPPDAVESAGHRYRLYKQQMTWHEAKRFCEEQGGHLVTITSEEENDLVRGLARAGGGRAWIGLTDEREEGVWEWVTGEKVTFKAWAPGEPSGTQPTTGKTENWGNLLAKYAHLWNDEDNKNCFFLCEWEPGRGPPPPPPPDLARGLVGHWTFDEGEGTVAGDSSRAANHGRIVGATPAEGRIGGALAFDGKAYVDVDSGVTEFGKADFTVSVWLKTAANGGAILAKSDNDGTWENREKQFYVSRIGDAKQGPVGSANLVGNNCEWISGSAVVSDGEWHHVVWTWSAAARKGSVCVDGRQGVRLVNYRYKGGGDNAGNKVRIGFDTSIEATTGFVGLLDDVRIYSRVLSPAEMRELAAMGGIRIEGPDPSRGLVGHWTFDESEGNAARDSSGEGHDGQVHGATWTEGRIGGALVFDGEDDSVETPPFANPTRATTLVCWVKSGTANWNASGMLVAKRDAFILHPVAGGKLLQFYVHQGDWRHADFTVTGDITRWRHYAGSYDSGTGAIGLYVDGRLVATKHTSGALTADTGSMFIGRDEVNETDDRWFNGAIDDCRIYDRALTAEEIGMLASPEKLAREAERRGRFAALLGEFDALVDKGDYAGARERMQGAEADIALGSADVARAATQVADTLAARRAAARRGAGALEGKVTEFRTVGSGRNPRGTVTGVSDEGIAIRWTYRIGGEEREKTAMVAWATLALGEEDELAAAGGWKPEGAAGAIAHAHAALARGDVKAAEQALEGARGHSLEPHVRARVEAAKRDEAERSAPAVWRAIERKAKTARRSPTPVRSVMSEIDAFEAEYGRTEFARSNAGAISEAKRHAWGLVSQGLVGHWKLDEGEGPTARDSSGRGNHGKIKGARWAEGRIGGALQFDGRGDVVCVGTFDPSGAGGEFSIAMWVKWNGATRGQCIMAKRDNWNGADMMWQFMIFGNATVKLTRSGSEANFGATVSTGTWTHVAVTFDGKTAKLYFDGILKAARPFLPGTDAAAAVVIGACSVSGGEGFNGVLDDVRVYDRALSAGEAAALAAFE